MVYCRHHHCRCRCFGYCFTFRSNNNASSSASSFHNVLRNTHTDDVLSRVFPSLIFPVRIHEYVFAISHSIFHSLLVPSVVASVLSNFLQAELYFHVIAITHNKISSLVVLVCFRPRSFASLSCNPDLGLQGCNRMIYCY